MSFFVCDLIINIQVAINLIKTVQQIKAQQQVHKYRICLSWADGVVRTVGGIYIRHRGLRAKLPRAEI